MRAEGDLDFRGTLGVDREAPVGFSDIRLSFDVVSDATQEQLDQLLKLTERYCVVLQTLRSAPPVSAAITSLRPDLERQAVDPLDHDRRTERGTGALCACQRSPSIVDLTVRLERAHDDRLAADQRVRADARAPAREPEAPRDLDDLEAARRRARRRAPTARAGRRARAGSR